MTEKQKFYHLLALTCEALPHYAVDMTLGAGYEAPATRLHDVKRGRTVSLADLVAIVTHALPRFEIPAHLLPEEQAVPA